MPESAIHVLITLVAIPVVLILFQRFINKADAAKEKEETGWRESVKQMFSTLEGKLTSYCAQNRMDHEQLYADKNDLMERVAVIENTHHQRGCDQPYDRRAGNGARK